MPHMLALLNDRGCRQEKGGGGLQIELNHSLRQRKEDPSGKRKRRGGRGPTPSAPCFSIRIPSSGEKKDREERGGGGKKERQQPPYSIIILSRIPISQKHSPPASRRTDNEGKKGRNQQKEGKREGKGGRGGLPYVSFFLLPSMSALPSRRYRREKEENQKKKREGKREKKEPPQRKAFMIDPMIPHAADHHHRRTTEEDKYGEREKRKKKTASAAMADAEPVFSFFIILGTFYANEGEEEKRERGGPRRSIKYHVIRQTNEGEKKEKASRENGGKERAGDRVRRAYSPK